MLHPVHQDATHSHARQRGGRHAGAWPRTGMAMAMVVALLLVFQAPAQAHAGLVSSDPSDGATLASPPRQFELEFSESINPDMAKVLLTVDESGGVEMPISRGARDNIVVIPMPDQGPNAGRWRLDYRVVSVDGHPITGTLNFTVSSDARTADASPSQGPSASSGGVTVADQPEVTVNDQDEPNQGWGFTAPAVIALLALLFLGVVLKGRRKGRSARAHDRQ